MAKTRVAIGFKSGNEIRMSIDEMNVVKDAAFKVEKISWKGGPQLLFMSLSDIEYVIEVDA